jgi:hypothetical protein
MPTTPTIHDLLEFLTRLKAANIHYRLSDPTDDAVMVEVAVPGERWEIEFHEDGTVGVEIFKSSSTIKDKAALADLFERFKD